MAAPRPSLTAMLCERLGGVYGIATVVDDFIDCIGPAGYGNNS